MVARQPSVLTRRAECAEQSASPTHTLPGVEDAELVVRLRSGDEEAFRFVVQRYHASLLRLAQTMVPTRAVAEEVVQDTWLGLVRGINRFEGRSSLRTWLFHVLVNRARSTGAHERRPAAGL